MICKHCNFYEHHNISSMTLHENNCWNNPNSLKQHNTNFYCDKCEIRFMGSVDMRKHNSNTHKKLTKDDYTCEYCNKEFYTTETYYNRHLTKCPLNKGTIKCKHCNKRNTDKSIIEEHELQCAYNPKNLINNLDYKQFLVNNNDTNNIGIYKIITNDNKIYIGMTVDSFKSRWKGHRKNLRNNKHRCTYLQNYYNKHGIDDLSFEIIEEYTKPKDRKELVTLGKYILKREKELWITYSENNTMLNVSPTGTGSVVHSEETKSKIRKAFENKEYAPKLKKKRKRNTYRRVTTNPHDCNNKNCSNLAYGRNYYCSPNCDDRIIKNKCDVCGKSIKNRKVLEEKLVFCSQHCGNLNRYKEKAEQFDRVIELYEKGYSYTEIADEIGIISRQAVFNYVKKYKASKE